ncbi:hypothetical protein I79_025763 [Cricetulus griseus]|uniref:Uncharacterized protein n=1 Tax=Cricetulus griseus TaxID=10029 RepID=G3IP60_CRIGR|nr:hypothetical protein I79_025763 [Cricetulus griseus]
MGYYLCLEKQALNIQDAVLNHIQRYFQVAIRRAFLIGSPIIPVVAVICPECN